MSAVEQIAAFLKAETAKTPMVDLHRKGVLDGIRATLRHMRALEGTGLHSSSFILDARQALKEADAALGKGHVAPQHESNLKARMADLLTHATYLEAQVAAPEAPRDDSERPRFYPGQRVRHYKVDTANGTVVAVQTTVTYAGEHLTVTVDWDDELGLVIQQANQIFPLEAPVSAAPKPVALAYDTEAVAAKILAFFDRARGLCYCQEYRGETHDTHPPCSRRREANLLAIDLKPEAPRG